VEYFWRKRRVDVTEVLCRPRVEDVEERAAGAAKYGEESLDFCFSWRDEEGGSGERGESTGDGSSSRIERRDGEDCEVDSAIRKVKFSRVCDTATCLSSQSGRTSVSCRKWPHGYVHNAMPDM
jgi:hypothetical protein